MRILIVALLCVSCSGGIAVEATEPEEIEVREVVSIPRWSEALEVEAVCPDEAEPLDGLCHVDGPGELELVADELTADGWRCSAFNASDKGARLVAVVTCQ